MRIPSRNRVFEVRTFTTSHMISKKLVPKKKILINILRAILLWPEVGVSNCQNYNERNNKTTCLRNG